MLTAGQAAKRAGVSKTTISTSLKSGRLSYVERVGTQYRIDPAEVDRVFGDKVSQTDGLDELKPQKERGLTDAERTAYDAQIATMRELIDELKGERDHLRTLTLSDQRSWWRKLVG